jgi:hypothetical protein
MIRALLIDHRHSSVKNITRFFEDQGGIVLLTAKNAFDATIELVSGNFNAVISYHHLEDINGIESIWCKRYQDTLSSVPINLAGILR